MNYTVSLGADSITVRIQKRTQDHYSFIVATQDDTAVAPKDYEAVRQLVTMKAHETIHEVNIQLKKNVLSGDEEFKIVLLDEQDRTQLPGTDTAATIRSSNEDGPGSIGFK
jgi:tricorn protease-like protein